MKYLTRFCSMAMHKLKDWLDDLAWNRYMLYRIAGTGPSCRTVFRTMDSTASHRVLARR